LPTCGGRLPTPRIVPTVKNKFRKLDGVIDVASLNEHEPTEITEILRMSMFSLFESNQFALLVLESFQFDSRRDRFSNRSS
jgi:hypothetical protein